MKIILKQLLVGVSGHIWFILRAKC